MKTLKVPIVDGKPQWGEGEWGHPGIPSRYTDQLCTVEVRFMVQGRTIGTKKFLWVSDNVRVRGDSYRYERLGYLPYSRIGGMVDDYPWMLLEIYHLGRLLQSAVSAVDEAHRVQNPSEAETKLREELGDALEDRDFYRAEWRRITDEYEMLQDYLGELLSTK